MSREYDATIAEHYRKVAQDVGLSWSSTMNDEPVRRIETESVESFLDAALQAVADKNKGRALVADVGCGNGYTLGTMAKRFQDHDFVGIEMSDDLRALTEKRVAEDKLNNVTVRNGDIRDDSFAEANGFDVVVCQRVIINLLDPEDQSAALKNIMASVRPGGFLLFIEAFKSSLDRLNEARSEFDLEALPPAHHNLYLEDDFFEGQNLQTFEHSGWNTPPNVLSTHYYTSRVIFPILLGDKPLVRNSHFVKFYAKALPTGVGDYSPVRILAYSKA